MDSAAKEKESGSEGEIVLHKPSLQLAQQLFLLQHSKAADPAQCRQQLTAAMREDQMAPFYVHCCEVLGWMQEDELLTAMRSANAATLAKLDAAVKDAEENQGELEVRDALVARAIHFATIGDRAAIEEAFRRAYEKTVSVGLRMDLCFALIRLGVFFHDKDLITRNIQKAETLLEQGGDWDRRNRLKVYQGISKVLARDFKEAATLFLETVSTFTSTELMSYTDFVGMTSLVAIIALDRPDLRDKVVNGPEIREALHSLPLHRRYVDSLYSCNYKQFFLALAEVESLLSTDRLFSEHTRYYVREMRIKAYSQLLQSYRSVTLASMAAAFGVSVGFIDRELSRFVAAGRLNCKIDKVAGVVETTRPDQKNSQYQAVIKKGDLVLNRLQKLAQVINV